MCALCRTRDTMYIRSTSQAAWSELTQRSRQTDSQPPARRPRLDDGESPAPSMSDTKPSSLLRPRGSQGSMRESRMADSTPMSREQMSTTSAGSTPLLEASASFWHYDDILDPTTVQALADVYYTTVYPL